jgi:hypothetical protein
MVFTDVALYLKGALMALKILLVSFISCGMCLPAMADSIPTVNATYLNATFNTNGSGGFSGGGAGNLFFEGHYPGTGRLIDNIFPDGYPLGYAGPVFLDLPGDNDTGGGRTDTFATGSFGSDNVHLYGGVIITSPGLGAALVIPGTYTFPAVAKGSYIEICRIFDDCSTLPLGGVVAVLDVNLQGTTTLHVTPSPFDYDLNPFGVPDDTYTISFASTPAPEPAGYGFVLIGGALLAFLGTRARRRSW